MNVGVISQQFDTFYTYGNLIPVLRMFALSCLYRDEVKLKVTRSVFKIVTLLILLTVLNVLSLFFKIQVSNMEIKLSFRDFVQVVFLIGYFQYIIDLYFVYKYGGEICLEYLRVYDHIDRFLYMTYYSVIRRSIFNILMSFTIVGFFSYIFDFIVWGFSLSWTASILYCLNYFYSFLRMLVAVDIIANMIQLEYRLRSIGDILEDFYLSSSSLQGVVLEIIKNLKRDRQRKAKDSNRLDFLKTISINREYSITIFSSFYLLLLEQADFINTMYGFRMLIMCISLLIDITITINLAVRLIVGTVVFTVKISEFYTVASSLLRLVTQAALILGGVYRAENIYSELRRIVRVSDLLLVNKIIPNKTRDVVKVLRDLVISRPIQFHVVQLFTIDYRFLVSITSVVVTYTILLLQYMK